MSYIEIAKAILTLIEFKEENELMEIQIRDIPQQDETIGMFLVKPNPNCLEGFCTGGCSLLREELSEKSVAYGIEKGIVSMEELIKRDGGKV